MEVFRLWRLFVKDAHDLFFEPFLLFWYCHVAIVEEKGIVGFSERRDITVGVDVVALLYVGEYVIVVDRVTLSTELIESALRPNFC